MYIAGVGFIVLIFAVLLMAGLVPFTAPWVGGMLAILALGVSGPILLKAG